MKKTQKTKLTAAILAAAVNFSSCTSGGEVQNVYGPPVDYTDTSASQTVTTAAETTQTTAAVTTISTTTVSVTEVTEPTTTESSTEVTEPTTAESVTDAVETEPYTPGKESFAAVYGPPDFLD